MGSIADKLEFLINTKEEIKISIEAKGVTVSEDTPFRDYADKILDISGGGGETKSYSEMYKEKYIDTDDRFDFEANDVSLSTYKSAWRIPLNSLTLNNISSANVASLFSDANVRNFSLTLKTPISITASSYFSSANIGTLTLNNVTSISGSSTFSGATISDLSTLNNVSVSGLSFFNSATIGTLPLNNVTTISNNAFFQKATIDNLSLNNLSTISGTQTFEGATIRNLSLPAFTTASGASQFKNFKKMEDSELQALDSDVIWGPTELPNFTSTTGSTYFQIFGSSGLSTTVTYASAANQPKPKYVMIFPKLTSCVGAVSDTDHVRAFIAPKLVLNQSGYIINNGYSLETFDIHSFKGTNSTSQFNKCYWLKTIVLRNPTTVQTTTASSLFANCYHMTGTPNATYNPDGLKDGRIYVPDNLVDAYKADSKWSPYADQILPLSEYDDPYAEYMVED